MNQHVVDDQVAIRYADGVGHVWDGWEPTLRRCERLLGGHTWRAGFDGDELAARLRRAQYRAHTSAELAAGLVPPPPAVDAHSMLVGSLAACRDTLGVLAVRADFDELDDDTAEIGLHAVDVTRDAFVGARSTTALVHSWMAAGRTAPTWSEEPGRRAKAWSFALWLLVTICAALFVVLIVDVAILGAR